MVKNIKKIKKYNQEHILKFFSNLNKDAQNNLLNEIKRIDFKFLNELYVNSYNDEKLCIDKVDNLKTIKNINEEEYLSYGEKILKNYGIVLMAGGSASRLGLNIPKCLLKIKVGNKKISLIEIYINKLKNIFDKYQIFINLYIMTSSENDKIIKNFLESNNYFDYDKNYIKFFVQDELPLIDTFGKVILREKDQIWFVPNGNGNVFKGLKKSNLIKDMEKNKIKYLLFTGIDNPLCNLVDIPFLGYSYKNNLKLVTKTLYKENELDKSWVFCKYKNKPYMIDNLNIDKFTNIKDEFGEFIYRETNILYHLIHIDYVKRFAKINLRYHRAYKKYAYIDEFGNKVNPESNNAFKFEQFIYDAFSYADDMVLYRTNEKEFCPIKIKEDILRVEEIINKE